MLLGRQVRVTMSRIQWPAPAERAGTPGYSRRPIPPRVLPWLLLLVGGIVTLATLAAVLRPGAFATHDSPIMTWLAVFVAMSVTFSGLWVFPVKGSRQG
jgi:hypothetical protein